MTRDIRKGDHATIMMAEHIQAAGPFGRMTGDGKAVIVLDGREISGTLIVPEIGKTADKRLEPTS